jgi:hypothetical protein
VGYAAVTGTTDITGDLVPSGAPDVWDTFWFRYETGPTDGDEPIYTWLAGIYLKAELRLGDDGNLRLYGAGPSLSLLATGSTQLQTGTWYRIDGRCGSGSSGRYEVRINGTPEFAGNGDLRNDLHTHSFAGKLANRNDNGVDFYYDDILRTHSGFVPAGEIHILDLPPNADGSKQTGWNSVPGIEEPYQHVDDDPRLNVPEGDYWVSDTKGDERSVGFQTLADAGIDEVDQIYLLAANALLYGSAASAASAQVRLYSGSSFLRRALHNPPDFYNGRYVGAYLDPATAAAWTLSAIASVEFGVYNDDDVEVRCNFVACTVVFKPAS